MGECVLVIGGTKSGKSRYALHLCRATEKKYIFLATAQPIDEEMKEKIKRHKEERSSKWITVEEPVHIVEKIKELDTEETTILLDCLALWVNNLFIYKADVEGEINKLINILSYIKGTIIIISNEVGMGIVPGDRVSRRYRDLLGYANQQIASIANKVVLMIAGIPVTIKSGLPSKQRLFP